MALNWKSRIVFFGFWIAVSAIALIVHAYEIGWPTLNVYALLIVIYSWAVYIQSHYEEFKIAKNQLVTANRQNRKERRAHCEIEAAGLFFAIVAFTVSFGALIIYYIWTKVVLNVDGVSGDLSFILGFSIVSGLFFRTVVKYTHGKLDVHTHFVPAYVCIALVPILMYAIFSFVPSLYARPICSIICVVVSAALFWIVLAWLDPKICKLR